MGGTSVITVSRPLISSRRIPSRVGRIPLCAHVPRAGLRPTLLLDFASRGTRPTRPAGMAGGLMSIDRSLLYRLRAVDGPRSEVKEEGRAMPGPGDMSGGDRPLPAVRKVQKSAYRGLSTC
jgi:hypothetical protein